MPTECSESMMRVTVVLLAALTAPAWSTGAPANVSVPVFTLFEAPAIYSMPPWLDKCGVPAMIRMAQLAADDVNANPTLLPNTTLKLEFYDTAGDIGTAIRAMESAAFLEGYPGMIGPLFSGNAAPMAAIANAFDKPVLNYCSGDVRLGDRDAYPTFNRIFKLPYDYDTWADMLHSFGWTSVNVMYYVTESSGRTYLAAYGKALAQELRARSFIVTEIPVEYTEAQCVTDNAVEGALDELELSNSRILFNFLGGPDACAASKLMTRYEARGLTGQYQLLVAEMEFNHLFAHAESLNRSLFIDPSWGHDTQPATSKLNTFINERLVPGYGEWFLSEFNKTVEWPWSDFTGGMRTDTGTCAEFVRTWMPITCGRPPNSRPWQLCPPPSPPTHPHPPPSPHTHATTIHKKPLARSEASTHSPPFPRLPSLLLPRATHCLSSPCRQAATTFTTRSFTSLAHWTQPSSAATMSLMAPRS